MSTIKIFQISYAIMAVASICLLCVCNHNAKLLTNKDEQILIKDKEIERLNFELKGCVASLHTCEVMISGYTEGNSGKRNNGSNRV